MRWQSCRSASEVLDDNDVENHPQKARQMCYGEAQRNVENDIHTSERRENQQFKLSKESAQRETKRIWIRDSFGSEK